jgi:hypothetical protein
LDSSKYIARYLQLRKNKKLNVKGIYMVRDVRGVIHSFGKNVQTTKKPMPALLYYLLINGWAQLISVFDSRIIRIRYEDFVNNPDAILEKMETHIFGATTKFAGLGSKAIEIPHIIAGNRLRSQKELVIRKDVAWEQKISRVKQVWYYLLAAPIMIINSYKL